MPTLQINGFMTIAGSKKFLNGEKELALSASNNKTKALRAILIDTQGREVVLLGSLRLSKKGSLTASFNVKPEGPLSIS